MSSKKFLNPFKDVRSDQIQGSSRKISTAHCACRNADLNFTLVTGTTNGFIFQIFILLIESWGVCLTCLDCKEYDYVRSFFPPNLLPAVFFSSICPLIEDKKITS